MTSLANQTNNLVYENELIAHALKCLEARLRYGTEPLSNPKDVCSYLLLHLGHEKNEIFSVLFLDNQNRLLAFEKLFAGTINGAAIYPRRVVQRALDHNAAAVILAHNHPSGNCWPSDADKKTTDKFKTVLTIMDIKLLDHVIMSGTNSYSFAEHNFI